MPDTLTADEQQAADETVAAVEALRADSNRRLAAETRNARVRARRRENVLRAYWKNKTKS
jgi:hypothetical protein